MAKISEYLPIRLLTRKINDMLSGGSTGDKLAKTSGTDLALEWQTDNFAAVEWTGSQVLGSGWTSISWTATDVRGCTIDGADVTLPAGKYFLTYIQEPSSITVRIQLDASTVEAEDVIDGGTLTADMTGLGLTATKVRVIAIAV